jgi:hypothetical protein
MIAVDTNVVVCAHRTETPKHEQALGHLRTLATGDSRWCLPVFCLGEFIRVVTHPRIFNPPSTIEEATAALDVLLACPTIQVLLPGPAFPSIFAAALREADARGNLAFDAQIAAVCMEHGVKRLLTLDRDFSRFAQIRCIGLGERAGM